MGMDSRVRTLTRHLKAHDSQLYAACHKEGRIDIYRKSSYGESPPHLIFPLTDNWAVSGRPVEWGIEVILARINAMDLWRSDSVAEDLIKSYEKRSEAQERDRKNNMESFLYDFAPQFAKATNDINTSCLEKIDGRREKEKNFYGNY